jgi:hypothetical protein
MATGQDSADAPTPEAAARALAEVEARRRLVEAEHRRHVPFELAVWSAALLLDYAAKDVLPGRRRRLAATALCQLAGAAALALNPPRVRPWWRHEGDQDEGSRDLLILFAACGYALVVERGLVWALRRSRLRRPNTVAGLVLAVTRPATTAMVYRRLFGSGR